MKGLFAVIRERKWYLSVVLLLAILLGGCLWILKSREFLYLLPAFLMVSVFLLLILMIREGLQNRKEQELLSGLLSWQEDKSRIWEEELSLLPPAKQQMLKPVLSEYFRLREELQLEQEKRKEYEEYIESWAHEIKVPLSLFTLLLENRRQGLDSGLYQRLAYVNQQMAECVQQILYYARLKAVHKDYAFSTISLRTLCEEIVEEKKYYFSEQGIRFLCKISDGTVYTDEKGLRFIVEQILNNALKYRDERKTEKYIRLYAGRSVENDRIYLSIWDNGIGAREEELPFLFDQGFTGDTGEDKKKATGMGLYLAEQMAGDIGVELSLTAKAGEWFQVTIAFPVVESHGQS